MHPFHEVIVKDRGPLWLPAANYYLFTAATSFVLFFLLWGVLHDGLDDLPWIIAGIVAALAFCTTVFIREVLMRSAHERFLSAKRLDKSVRQIPVRKSDMRMSAKLTLERNETILSEIRKKSEAAKVLGKFAEAHREVVDLCNEYLNVAADELANARSGSPRIPAIRKGRDGARLRHRYHMLQWAEIEARSLTQAANASEKAPNKLERAQKALGVVDQALESYPHESALIDSRAALQGFLTSIRVSDSIEKAERAFHKGNNKRAISLYRTAIADLKRSDIDIAERDRAAEKIESEISRIKQLKKPA